MILLTGISGTTGMELVKALTGKDVPLRAMVRNPDRVRDAAGEGLELVQGDFEDPASILKAMEGVDTAFMLMPNTPAQLDWEKQYVDLARQAGVSCVVKLSASSADADSEAQLKYFHGQSEIYLAQSGLDYVIVRPNFYMQNMLQSAPTIISDNRFFLPMGEGRVGAIDVRDVARFLAVILTSPAEHLGRTHLITGSEIISFGDMAVTLSEVLGREITYVDVPPEAFSEELRKYGVDEWYIGAVGGLFRSIAAGNGAKKTDTFTEICNRPPKSFKKFVEDYAGAFTA